MNTARIGSFNRLESLVVVAIVAIHLVLSAICFPQLWELMRVGAVSVLAGLVWIVGLISLNAATAQAFMGRKLGFSLLSVAAVGLAYSAFKFGLPHPPALIAAIGAILAVLVLALAQPWAKGKA